MKKLFTVLLSTIMAFACFVFVGCDNGSAENYVEVTAEQKETIAQRFNAIAEAEELNADIVGVNVEGVLAVAYVSGGNAVNGVANYTLKTDETEERMYARLSISTNGIKTADVSMIAEEEDNDYLCYLTASLIAPVAATTKHIVRLNDVPNINGSEAYAYYINLLKTQKIDYTIADIITYLNMAGVKVYMDGNDKIKVVTTTTLGGVEMVFTFKISLGANNDYSITVAFDASYAGSASEITAHYSMTIKPSTERISLPADTSDYVVHAS